MNKKEFIREIAHRSGLSEYSVNEIYNISYELVAEKLISGENVDLPKVGSFVLITKNARNILQGTAANIARSCVYPYFKTSETLKNRVKNAARYKKSSEKL